MIKTKIIDEKITIGYSNLRISLPIFIAKEKKLFKEFGLINVEFKKFDTAEELVNSIMTNNEISFGGYCALPIAFMLMIKKRAKLSFLSGIFEDDQHPISFLLANKDFEFSDEKNCKNLKIGYFPTSAYKAWLEKILIIKGIRFDENNLVKINPKNQSKKLQDREIDILLTNNPIASKIIEEGIGKLLFPNDKAIIPDVLDREPFYFGSFVANHNFTKENPNIISRISRIIDKAISLINENKDTASLIGKVQKKYLDYDETIIKNIGICNYKKTNEVKDSHLDNIRRYYFDQGIINQKLNVKYLQYNRTNSFRYLYNKYYLYEKVFDKRKAVIVPLGFLASSWFGYYLSNLSTKDTINSQVEQFQEQLIQDRKSIPAQFLLSYVENENEEGTYYVNLTNIGHSTLINVKADIDYYFYSNKDELFLASILHKTLPDNYFSLLNSKYNSRNQIESDLNDYRELHTQSILKPSKESNINKIGFGDNNSSINFDNSTSIIKNAIDIKNLLGFKLIARWKISYFEEISKERKVVYKYMWFSDKEYIKDKYGVFIVDLEEVIGGKKIINLIPKYEDNTKDIIF